MNDNAVAHPPAEPASTFWRRLLHRWLIEYNPLYLLSAMLVLGGMILSSRGLAREGSLYGQVGVAAIAELYAGVLIGGAALLTRIGQRRPAVMLALLTVLYQCDLTLHTEASANLGSLGVWASMGWLALFLLKLGALARAVKLRFSSAALATAALGAIGMTVLPHVLDRMDPSRATMLIAVWLFTLSVVQRFAVVTSLVDLDTWGTTVLTRAVRATWILWTSLLVLHVAFWTLHYRIDAGTLLFVGPLAATRWIRRESRIWIVAVASLLLVALDPRAFSTVALLVAGMLGVRSWMAARSIDRHGEALEVTAHAHAGSPYRFSAEDAEPPPTVAIVTASLVDGLPASRRFFAGALFATYLSVWTLGWKYGPWPSHILPLDLALGAFVAFGIWKVRARIALAPLAAAYTHFVWHARLIPLPHTTLGWGGASVGLGFILLVASIGATYWLKRTEPKEAASIAGVDPMS